MQTFQETTPSQPPPIETRALDNVREIDPQGTNGVLEKMITNYFNSTPKHIATLQEASAVRDAERIRQAAHSLKSNSAFVGARQLASMCENLEAMARENAVERTPEIVSAIGPEYERVRLALAAELAPEGF